MSFYQFTVNNLGGISKELTEYQGKVVLVVNTASKCGLTPQYKGLEELYQKYKDQGLEILGFPCDQFAHQEPGSSQDIDQFCKRNYGVSFPMFEKIKVNGKEAHPLYKYLKESMPGKLGNKIKWNFTKFLLDRQGNPIKRFSPMEKPEDLELPILQALQEA